jgi:hypothetical protein
MLRVTDILEAKPAGHQRLPDRLRALRTGHPLVQLDDDRANPREIHVRHELHLTSLDVDDEERRFDRADLLIECLTCTVIVETVPGRFQVEEHQDSRFR